MAEFVDVPDFFSSIYLVDFSPSLCEVARKRFARLGWKNVKVVCQDARAFRLEDHETPSQGAIGFRRLSTSNYFSDNNSSVGGADLITLSYSLSMIVRMSSRIVSQLLNLRLCQFPGSFGRITLSNGQYIFI
jgi:betaine lipid synthase